MTRAELIEALETAQGADRELDRDIADAIGAGPPSDWARKPRIADGCINFDCGSWVSPCGGLIRHSLSYTGLIDAAMMLATGDMDNADIGVMLNEAAYKCILAGCDIRTDLPRFIAAACLRAGGE